MRSLWLFRVVLIGAAAGAGWLLALVGMPAAWFLGPMIAAGSLICFYQYDTQVPGHLNLASLAIIGTTMSAATTPDALLVFVHYWWSILIIIGALLVTSLISGVLVAGLGRIDLVTALLGMLPGGAPGMIALSDALHADTRLVAIMQTLRVMLVVAALALVAAFIQPDAAGLAASSATPAYEQMWVSYAVNLAIAGAGTWAGLRLRLPAGALVGPALLGMLLGLSGLPHAPWPAPITNLAYAALGLSVGLQFDLEALRLAGRLVPVFLLSTLFLMASAAGLGWLFALLTGLDFFSTYLATAPGGLSVAVILALESGANVVLVLTISLLRFLVIMLAGAPLVRWMLRHVRLDERHVPRRGVPEI